jgi:hypothetical protein
LILRWNEREIRKFDEDAICAKLAVARKKKENQKKKCK